MIKAVQPSAILFDVGLVLLHPDGKKLAATLSDVLGLKVDPIICLNAYSRTIRERDAFDVPNLGDEWFWKTWCSYAQIPSSLSKKVSAIVKVLERSPEKLWTSLDSGAHIILEALKESEIRLGVISNADGELLHDLQLAGLVQYLDSVIDSELVGTRKPEKRIFELGLQAMHLKTPENCWFIGDDMFHDIRPTISMGFGAVIHYDRLGIYGSPSNHYRIIQLEELLEFLKTGINPILPNNRLSG